MDSKIILAFIWALCVGMSIPLESCNTALLNQKATDTGDTVIGTWHGYYVSDIAVAMGGLQLLIPSFYSKVEWKRPSKWWSYLGGACSIFGFITVSASPILGVQLMLMVQMIGTLGTFFLIDVLLGAVTLADWQKPLGFGIALIGVGVDNLGMFKNDTTINSSWILHFVGTFISGVGYALQARCNGALAEDLGGPARAASVSAVVNLVAGAPVVMYVALGLKVPILLNFWLWPLWFVAGFQSAFYIGSMAMLPKLLGFTACYLAVLCAKLVCSTLVDAEGWGGKVVPVSWHRIASLALVIFGAFVFNYVSAAPPAREILLGNSTEAAGADDIEKTAKTADNVVVGDPTTAGADDGEKTAKTADNVPLAIVPGGISMQ